MSIPQHIKIRLTNIVLLFMSYGFIMAQENEHWSKQSDSSSINKDVKVGIVLSGGGAKGLAHIGALKVIEDLGIRIDYIGGTSMGAIVGSLYASGYNAKQLDSIFRSADFDAFIQDELPRQAKTFYEREDSEKYAITLPFDNFKIDLPKGLSKGQNFYNQFSRYTQHVNRIRNFDSLPIPFFCMATNIENGAPVLLDKGYLPEAVSASSALPSVFSPVEVDGVLMTDGGVTNNYPVREIREKGAEIVIGIDVQDSLMLRKELNSVTNIMLQISNFRTINDMKDKAPKTDVYIKPSIENFSVISFDQAEDIIAAGEKAAFDQFEKLKEIKQVQKTPPSSIKIENVSDSLNIDIMSITGNNAYTRSYILGKLKLKSPANTTYQKLNEGINNLSATGNFDRISHRLISTDNGNALLLNVKESDNKMLFRFALHYDDLLQTAALVNLTRKRLLFNNDIFSFDLALGDNIRYNVDYYIDKGYYWSIGLNSRFYKFDKDVDVDFLSEFGQTPDLVGLNSVNIDYQDFTTSLYFETLFKRTFSLGVGAEYKRLRILSDTFGEDADQLPRTVFDDSDYWSVFGYLKLDTYDNKYFPTKGFLFDGDIHAYLFSSDFSNNFSQFSIAKATFGYATPIADKFSLNLNLEAGTKIGDNNVPSLDFLLGGFGAKMINNFIPFYGYDFIGITGESFAKTLLTIDYEIFNKNHINVSANFANVGNKLFSTGDWLNSPEYTGYAFGYGLETFAGPIQIKFTYSPELDESEWFFSVGFWF